MENFNHQSRSHYRRRAAMIRKSVAVMFLSTFFSGCAPVSPTASEDRALFDRLCNAPDRDFIKRVVSDNGYAKAQILTDTNICTSADIMPKVFTEMGYRHFECVKGRWLDGNNQNMTTYRFSLRKNPDPACDRNNEHVERANDWLDLWLKNNPTDQFMCIGATKQKFPSSRYVQLDDNGRVTGDGRHVPGKSSDWRSIPGYISFSRTRIFDTKTRETIAEKKLYFYYPASARYSDLASYHCESINAWRITDVIRPK